MSDREIINWVFYGHLWIALAATGLSWLSLRVTYGHQSCVSEWPVLTFVFFSTLSVYTLHRFLSFQRAERRPTTLRYGIVRQHPRTSLMVGGVSTLAAGILGLKFISTIWPAILLALPVTVFYLTPPASGWRRLRDLPYLKNLWVALAWTVMTVVVPILVMESWAFRADRDAFDFPELINLFSCVPVAPLNYQNFSLELVTRLLFTGCIAMLFDLRDVALDRAQGVCTVAGEHPFLHRILVFSCLVVCALANFLCSHSGLLDTGIGAVMCLGYFLMVPVAFFTYRKSSEDWYAVVVNGLLLLPPLVYWLADILGADAGAVRGL